MHSERGCCRHTSVLVCLYEMLLHVDGEDPVVYAEAAHVAANLVSNTVEGWIVRTLGR
jgi:hypothetical protein